MVNKTHIFPETIPQIYHKTMDKKLFESKIDSTNQLQKEKQCRNECPKFYLLVSGRRPWIRQNVIVCFFFEWSFGVPIVSTFGKSRRSDTAVHEKLPYHETHWCWNGAAVVFIVMQKKGSVLVDSGVFRPE